MQSDKLHIYNYALRGILILSMLLSVAVPAAAEIQKPAGTAAGNPYDYVSSGAVNNPSGSGTEVSFAKLTENPYSTDTNQCGANVNNGTYDLKFSQTAEEDLFSYKIVAKTTNLKTNDITTEEMNLGINTKPRKLLNVYPSSYGMIGQRLMTERRSDGGRYYDDPHTGSQLFTFDSVYWDTFMSNPEAYMKNPDGTWKYDGIYLGAQDSNGGKFFSSESGPLLNSYIHDGFAVVVGHDVDIRNNGILTEYYGYSDDRMGARGTTVYVSDNSGTGAAGVSSDGNPLTTYPYKIPIGTALTVGESHTQLYLSPEKTNVWLTYRNYQSYHNGFYTDAYLFTSKAYPNVATSQAGHTTPQENDLKLIVNMLLYILSHKHKINEAEITVKDIAAPAQPSVTGQKRTGETNLVFNVVADDFATKFDFSLQATSVYNNSTRPATTMNDATIKSGTTWYLYSADTDPNGTVSYTKNCLGLPVAGSGTALIEGDSEETLNVTIPSNAKYLHIAAVDQAGNISEVTTVEILQTEDLTIWKEWEDFDNRFDLRGTEIVFDAFPGSSETSAGNCTATADTGYVCTINNLLAYDENGDEITYTVRERNKPNAYSSDDISIKLTEETSMSITNTLVTKNIKVSKVWAEDRDDLFSTRPDSITFDAVYSNEIFGSCTTDSEHDWNCVIRNLPVYNASGDEITYTIREHKIPTSYSSEDVAVTGKDAVEAEVTNNLVTKDISVTKVWEDQENKFDQRLDTITYDLYAANIEDPVSTCTADEDADWSCTFTGLPKVDKFGEPIVYTVKEHEVPKSYTATEPTIDTADGNSAEITNTLIVKDLEVSKIWEGDFDNLYNTRPVQITFDVYHGETVYRSCSARVENNWKCSVPDLAVYNKFGDPIVYTVKERNVPRAYTADEPTVTEAEQTSVSLTNTLVTKDVVATKIWDDLDNAYSSRTASLQFDLYQNDVKKDSCTVSPETSWKCAFSGLPVYDPIGVEQKYVIRERDVPVGYSTKDVTVSGKDTVTAEVTNKLETKDITVIKNWTDSNDHDRKRPESIVLKLFKDGELFKTKEINAAENSLSANVWSYVFTNIPKYNERGEPAVYSVKEFPSG